MNMIGDKNFTPALGLKWLTPLYDVAIALLTRERFWRGRLVAQIAPMSNDRIVDIGCGTGSLAIMLKLRCPGANVLGIDPDPEVLARARKKAAKLGVEVQWLNGFLTKEAVAELPLATKVVSSLVLHQTRLDEKLHILENACNLLESSGELHIADYGLQRTKLMRFLFRHTVQAMDGIEDTQPNADGILPELMTKAGFMGVVECAVIPTLTGSISLYRAGRDRPAPKA
jgi:SAM-dependent methyltransferase